MTIVFPDSSYRQFKQLATGVRARTFWNDNIMLALVDFDPFSKVPVHSHPHDQAGIVLEGEIEFYIAGETKTLRSGQIYLIPGGVEHGASTSQSPAQVLDIFSPVRENLKY